MKQIPLTQGRVAIVDDEDYKWLSQWHWQFYNGYAARKIYDQDGTQNIKMHRQIMAAPDGLVIDHINYDGLDNRRSNLQICTQQINAQRARPTKVIRKGGKCEKWSEYKGVSWHTKNGKWRVRIYFNNKNCHVGCFTSEEDAALAYNVAAQMLFGSHAYLNPV